MAKFEQQEIFTVSEYKKIYTRAKGAKVEKKEEKLQIQVCEYIKLCYPNVIFTCDLASGLRLPIWLGKLHKKMRSSRGLPDLLILHKKPGLIIYHGLVIELKDKRIRLKSGGLASSDHLKEQLAILERLKLQGFFVSVACGFDEAKKLIDNYLKT